MPTRPFRPSRSSPPAPAPGRRATPAPLLRAVLDNLQDGVIVESEDDGILFANETFCRMFDLPAPAQLVGGSMSALRQSVWTRLIADVAGHAHVTAGLRRERRPQLGREVPLTDGRVLDRDYVPVTGTWGVAHMWHYRDVTGRRRLEMRVRESRRRVRRMAAHLERTREDERRTIARSLHDELGQLFSSIRLELSAAVAAFQPRPDERTLAVVDRLQAAVGLTDVGIASLRTLTTALRPPVLDHFGLVPAIRWAADLFSQRTGIRVHVHARPEAFDLEDTRATALYRILQEALENVQRHAGAGTVWIRVAKTRRLTRMEVRDNGRGISAAAAEDATGMGLLGMRERALSLGGVLRIAPGTRRGTRLEVLLPDAT